MWPSAATSSSIVRGDDELDLDQYDGPGMCIDCIYPLACRSRGAATIYNRIGDPLSDHTDAPVTVESVTHICLIMNDDRSSILTAAYN